MYSKYLIYISIYQGRRGAVAQACDCKLDTYGFDFHSLKLNKKAAN